jgi:hypothetical protein
MLNAEAMRVQLDKISSESIAQVYDALHDCKDETIHSVALDILWSRHATVFADPGRKWEEIEMELGNPNDALHEDFREPDAHRRRHLAVWLCALAKDQHDPLHQVRRSLNWSYNNDRGARAFVGLECTCGLRERPNSISGLDLKLRQVYPTARVWPMVMRDGIPHYQVCKRAKCADDPYHAPSALGSSCWCGGYLARHNYSGEDQFLPAY